MERSTHENDYKLFNEIYENFILQLREYFPNTHQLEFYLELFKQFKKANYKVPARLFLSSIAEHSLHIFNKDESYFLSGVQVTKTRSRAIIENTIVQHWTNLPEDKKNCIWFYLQRMLLVVAEIRDDDVSDTAEEEAERIMTDALVRDQVINFK